MANKKYLCLNNSIVTIYKTRLSVEWTELYIQKL